MPNGDAGKIFKKPEAEFRKLHGEWVKYHKGRVVHPETGEEISRAELRESEISDIVEKGYKDLQAKIGKKGRVLRREEIEPHIHHGTKFTGSAAMNLCYTACGRFDGNIGASLHPHDIAAGILIAKEAGADVLNFTGDPATFLDPDIVVGNRDMTSNMLKYIKRAVRSRRK